MHASTCIIMNEREFAVRTQTRPPAFFLHTKFLRFQFFQLHSLLCTFANSIGVFDERHKPSTFCTLTKRKSIHREQIDGTKQSFHINIKQILCRSQRQHNSSRNSVITARCSDKGRCFNRIYDSICICDQCSETSKRYVKKTSISANMLSMLLKLDTSLTKLSK